MASDSERTGKWELEPLKREEVTLSPDTVLSEYRKEIVRQMWGVVDRASLDPRYYNCGKIALACLTGIGELQRAGQAPMSQPNTTIYQNILILQNMSASEREQLREFYRQQALAEPTGGPGSHRSVQLGAGEDHPGTALVVAKLHQDV
jgi:hypothetical protein